MTLTELESTLGILKPELLVQELHSQLAMLNETDQIQWLEQMLPHPLEMVPRGVAFTIRAFGTCGTCFITTTWTYCT